MSDPSMTVRHRTVARERDGVASYETSESFAGLLLRHRGRTGLTQRELAARIGVSRGSVQDWEAGLSYPDAQHLQALIGAFLETGALTIGAEANEAEALWATALDQAPRMQIPFDAVWWAGLLARREASPGYGSPADNTFVLGGASTSDTSERRQDWGEAPDV